MRRAEVKHDVVAEAGSARCRTHPASPGSRRGARRAGAGPGARRTRGSSSSSCSSAIPRRTRPCSPGGEVAGRAGRAPPRRGSPQQRQAAHVAHEDPPARAQRRRRALQHPQQVVEVREVLGDRVEDDQVELRRRSLRSSRSASRPTGSPVREAPRDGGDVLQRHPREVGPVVGRRVRRHAEEQEPRPAPHLQHRLRPSARMRSAGARPTRASPRAGSARPCSCCSTPSVERRVRVRLVRRRCRRRAAPWPTCSRTPPAVPDGRLGVRARNDVGDQAPVPGVPVQDSSHGLPDAGLLAQHGLDLAGLDAEAADLDLLVDPAQELQRAVRAPAGAVARAVGALARADRDEVLRRQLRPAQVARATARRRSRPLRARRRPGKAVAVRARSSGRRQRPAEQRPGIAPRAARGRWRR